MSNKITVYTDGGSRGNPGPSALGVVIFMPEEKEDIFGKGGKEMHYSEYLGTKTNNEAEYSALVFALKKLKQLVGKKNINEIEVEVRTDSELIYSQLNGLYKIKEPSLKEYFLEIWNLKQDFKSVAFKHIPREENKLADKLVNKELDKKA